MISNVLHNMFSVGIEIIDEQHLVILRITNNLNDAILSNDTEKVKLYVRELIDFTSTHFQYEEQFMDIYPDYKYVREHKAAHAQTKESLQEIVDIVESGVPINGYNVMLFLREWLAEHILSIDRDFGTFLMTKGLK